MVLSTTSLPWTPAPLTQVDQTVIMDLIHFHSFVNMMDYLYIKLSWTHLQFFSLTVFFL